MSSRRRLEAAQVSASRRLLQFRKRSRVVKRLVPDRVGGWLTLQRSRRTQARRRLYQVAETCQFDNVFHVTLHKSGSQWLLGLLLDPVVYRYSGLTHFQPGRIVRGLSTKDRWYDRFPDGTIVSPLYVSRDQFLAIEKGSYAAFAVLRDPRELMVSWYFSALRNHPLRSKDGNLARARAQLEQLDRSAGLHFAIDYWTEHGRFDAFRSWASPGAGDVLVTTYERLTGPEQLSTFVDLFETLDIRMPEAELRKLLDDHSFDRVRQGGGEQVDTSSMRRAGGRRTWTEHLGADHLRRLEELLGDSLELAGYTE